MCKRPMDVSAAAAAGLQGESGDCLGAGWYGELPAQSPKTCIDQSLLHILSRYLREGLVASMLRAFRAVGSSGDLARWSRHGAYGLDMGGL